MTITEAKKEIIAVIVKSTETELEVTEETHLVKELGLSSVEAMILLSDLEDRFGIRIPVSRLRNVRTVNDLCQVVIDTLIQG